MQINSCESLIIDDYIMRLSSRVRIFSGTPDLEPLNTCTAELAQRVAPGLEQWCYDTGRQERSAKELVLLDTDF